MKKVLVCLMIISSLFGCSSAKKNYSYMNESNYQSRPTLTKSLIDPSKPLSEDAIQRILGSKVKIPRNLSLAVIRINSTNDFQRIDEEVAQKFYNKKNWGKRVQSVIPVPQILINYPISITSLRQSAVLLQADMLLIIKPYSFGDWKFKWFEENKAKATTSLEVLLLDTRTGIIPYTSIVTETIEIKKDREEYDNSELVARARISSEKKAFLQVGSQIKNFLDTIK